MGRRGRRVTRVCMHVCLSPCNAHPCSEQPGSAVITISGTRDAISSAQVGSLSFGSYDFSGASLVNGAAGLSLAPLSGLLALTMAVVNNAHILQ